MYVKNKYRNTIPLLYDFSMQLIPLNIPTHFCIKSGKLVTKVQVGWCT